MIIDGRELPIPKPYIKWSNGELDAHLDERHNHVKGIDPWESRQIRDAKAKNMKAKKLQLCQIPAI